MIVLGIETSCDETAVALVENGLKIHAHSVYTQIAAHRPYGGVVPEIACRSHVEILPGLIRDTAADSGLAWDRIDAVAVTYGPGLASSLLVGVAAGKALALRLEKPLIAINHLRAHIYSLFMGREDLSPKQVYPLLILLVSGGHTCLVRADSLNECHLLGQTLDDAAGEALDKGASVLGLGYPGGPAIEKAAWDGDPGFVRFPRGLRHGAQSSLAGSLERDLCFSFSGLKTSLRYYVHDHPDVVAGENLKNVAASYQAAVIDALVERLERALARHDVKAVACVGGVARNQVLRDKLTELAEARKLPLLAAMPEFCTDNAAMVAGLAGAPGYPAAAAGMDLDVEPNLAL